MDPEGLSGTDGLSGRFTEFPGHAPSVSTPPRAVGPCPVCEERSESPVGEVRSVLLVSGASGWDETSARRPGVPSSPWGDVLTV